jgi:hypothetical protein
MGKLHSALVKRVRASARGTHNPLSPPLPFPPVAAPNPRNLRPCARFAKGHRPSPPTGPPASSCSSLGAELRHAEFPRANFYPRYPRYKK